MQQKTKGIVLSTRPYNDNTSFVHIYTREYGPVTYAVPNSKGKKSKLSRSLFVPFTILDMEVSHSPVKDIHKIIEASAVEVNLSIVSDPVKSAIAIFLAEFLTRAIKENEGNEMLYNFIEDSVRLFNLIEDGKANFHLIFLTKIADLIGLRVHRESYSDGMRFNMIDGAFTTLMPTHSWFLSPDDAALFFSLLNMTFSDIHTLQLSREQRMRLLEIIIAYYKLHLSEVGNIKSLDVLKMLFG